MIKEIIYKLFGIEDDCKGCEILQHQIDNANAEKRLLLDSLLKITNPSAPVEEETRTYEPIAPRHMPWNVRKQMLEEKDRMKAEEERIKKGIEDIEKEVGINAEQDKKQEAV